MSRLIDADALMTELMDSDLDHLQRDDWKEVIQIVQDAPTITPEPHWIPVTEDCECDLMDNEEVLVCQKYGQIRHAMFYDFGGKKKFVTWEEGITIYNVVAYMPLPEPFKGVTE